MTDIEKIIFSKESNTIIQGHKSNLTDGYHTMEELYEHRYLLYINLALSLKQYAYIAEANQNGEKWGDSFILGIHIEEGMQISYHIPNKYRHLCDFVNPLDIYHLDTIWDGHTPQNVLERLELMLTDNLT